jgi:hypothetical protein
MALMRRAPRGPDLALGAFRRKWDADTNEEAVALATRSAAGHLGRLGAVDPVAVAQDHGARVLVQPWGPRREVEHGSLSVRDGQWCIEVPTEITAERRRFSIAHEIGHILIYEAVADEPALVREVNAPVLRPVVEFLCNLAAANLLMPVEATRSLIADYPDMNAQMLPELAEHFFVSYEAMARRIVELDDRWELVVWDWTTDHPRGAAWRTSPSQSRTGRSFVPAGMSSSRLNPDIVRRAADDGFAASDVVAFESSAKRVFFDARAWRNRRRTSIPLTADLERGTEKVFLLARSR